MEFVHLIEPLVGGILIGIAASMLLLFNGRVLGASGILGGLCVPQAGETAWRVVALLGMIAAGFVLYLVMPKSLAIATEGPIWRYMLAGVLVGFGTQLGSGCTSGHGVCGISRLSPRSIVATLIFMLAGIVTVACMRLLGVTP